MTEAVQLSSNSRLAPQPEQQTRSWLVIGMGSFAYGKERRAVSALKHMPHIQPHFLTTVWEDGSVSDLLRRNNFEFTPATVGYLGRAHPVWTLKNFVLMPSLFVKTFRTYRKNRCCGIVVLALQSFVNLLPVIFLLRKRCDARLVFYLGDIPANSGTNRGLARVVNSMADAIIANSEAVRRGLAAVGIGSESTRVVYNGVELKRFDDVSPLRWWEQFGWHEDNIIVGYAGQFAENKGVWDFLSAAELVLQKNEHCRFVLIGKKDLDNVCYRELAVYLNDRKLGDKIVFGGWISEMERAYASLDIVVVPSRHEEPAANVILEAMASALPVIATRTGGSPEFIKDGETGFLVSAKDPAAICEKVLQLSTDPELRQNVGNCARRRAASQFDVVKNAAEVERIMLMHC